MKKRTVLAFLVAMLLLSCSQQPKDVPTLKVGWAGHDHQSALLVACKLPEKTQADIGFHMKEIEAKKLYEMYKGKKKLANIEVIKTGGGSKMPTALAQEQIEVGFGGVAAFAFFVDKKTPLKIISPLHSKGDMLVVKPDNDVNSWETFVKWVNESEKPVRVGFKAPIAVAKLIFERALKEEGIKYTGDKSNREAKVLMVNMKGMKNLVPGLKNDIIDAYVANNPSCAIAESKKVGKIVVDLNDVPPGIWKDHPCCAIAATDSTIINKRDVVKNFLKLIIVATNYINHEQELVYPIVSEWVGTSIEVEKASIPTSGYSTLVSDHWKKVMLVWVNEMNSMGKLKGILAGKMGTEIDPFLYDFSILEDAVAELSKNGMSTQL